MGDSKIPKAVAVFRENAHRFPAKSWWGRVEKVVGEAEEDLEFWGLVVFYYVGKGWNPVNISNMIHFFEAGRVPDRPDLDRRVDQRHQRGVVDVQEQERKPTMEVVI